MVEQGIFETAARMYILASCVAVWVLIGLGGVYLVVLIVDKIRTWRRR